MKKFISYLLGACLLLGVLLFASCRKYLDKLPESEISSDQAFKNFTNFQGFTEQLYEGIPDFTNAYWTNNWNWGDDIVTSSDMDYQIVNMFDNGNFWGWQHEHNGWNTSWMDKSSGQFGTIPGVGHRFDRDLWHDGWTTIRKANLGLQNLDKMNGTQEEKDLIKGQLLFFRAWYYFQFMQYFGGLPYLTQVLPADQKFTQKRLSYQATADSAAKDFREAADLLPINWDNTAPGKNTLGNNTLRINKIMALGYLGKDLLWAGSPLMNYQTNGVKKYDQDYCKKAAEVFAELLKLVESGQTPYALVPFSDWNNIFYTTGKDWRLPGGTEAIFTGLYHHGNDANWGTSKQYQPGVIQDGANFYPAANYVDNYGMANGLPITDPASGYDPTHPWRDRDPRFYKTFIFDGEKVVQGSMPADQEQYRYANLYTGGNYRDPVNGSPTGYLLYKFIPVTANKFDDGFGYGHNLNIKVPYMRLAGIYIMYAEAAAEGYQNPEGHPPDFAETPVEALNKIRDRAGVGHIRADYSGSLDKFMGELRREWAVELGFEKHRFTNLRRWLLLTEAPYLNKTAIEFDRSPSFDPTQPEENEVVNLREKVIIERHYSEKHYWLPLKRNDTHINAGFYQNPGW